MNGLFPYSYIEKALEEDAQFPVEALGELERIQSKHKLKSTYSTASSASALLNHWLVNRELKCFERGRVVEDVTEATVNLECLEDSMAAIEDGWLISIAELMRLIQSKGMTFPMALCADAGITPEDDLANELGYTIRGAALALSAKYEMAYDAIHTSIFDAARQGKLTILDPRSGMPCDFDDRDFNQRIRIEDLNKWLKDSGVEYRLDGLCGDDGGSESKRRTESNERDSPLTPIKKQVLLEELRRYSELKNAMQANEPEFKACRVPRALAPGKKGGYYYREKVEAACIARWGTHATPTVQPSRNDNPYSTQVRGMRGGKKY